MLLVLPLIPMLGCVPVQQPEYACIAEDRDYSILEKYKPLYPRKAYEQKVSGWVIVKLNIDENGQPKNIVVIDGQPKGVFDHAAVEVIKRYRYTPRVINCNPMFVTGVEYKLTFEVTE